MNLKEKYNWILSMRSIGELTYNEYPSYAEFRRAHRDGRICGDYDGKLVIVSLNPRKNYTFVYEN